MPEAPVDEDGDASTWKYDVGSTAEVGQRRIVDAVAQSGSMKEPSDG
jgi:hypothetical protein